MMTAINSSFKISYDAFEQNDHTINAESFGTAVINLAEAIKNTDKIINGESSELIVKVKAPEPGSLMIDFIVGGGLETLQMLGLIALPTAAIGGSVLTAIREMGSKKIMLIEELDGEGQSKLTLEGNSELVVSKDVAKVLLNKSIRKNVEEVIYSPLSHSTQPVFKIISDDDNSDIIFETSNDDIKSYKTPPNISQELETETVPQVKDVRFTNVNFEGTSGWRIKLPNSETSVSVKMEDELFMERIRNDSEKFSKDGLFSVELDVHNTPRHNQEPLVKYTLKKVVRHRASAENKIL